MHEEKQEAKKGDAPEDSDKSARNRRLRMLILGTIAAGGAFQLNGWQAQAHGNRSSGSTQSIRAVIVPGDVQVTSPQTVTPSVEAPQKTE
jgi:hypothetical protein